MLEPKNPQPEEPDTISNEVATSLTADPFPVSADSLPDDLNPAGISAAAPPHAAWGLRQSDRLFLIGLSFLIALLTVVNLVRHSLTGPPVFEIDRLPAAAASFRIDINQANWVEWIQLPEIGEGLARQIVADRQSHGPFQSVDDLQRVKGIGPATMEKIRPFVERGELFLNPEALDP